MLALHLFGFLDFLRWSFPGFLIQAVGANNEGFDCATRVPKGKEAVGVVGRNHAEFVDAMGIDQLREVLNRLAALELANAGPEFLPSVFLQRLQEVPRFGREYRNNRL